MDDLAQALAGGYDTSDVLKRMPSRSPMKDLHGYVADWIRKRDEVPTGALAAALEEGPPKPQEPNWFGNYVLGPMGKVAEAMPAGAFDAMTTVLPGARPLPRIQNPIKAYHGSPHDFDKFDAAHIGKGEGAQAYGHGLYFAEHPEVAQTYKNTLAAEEPGKVFRNGERIVDPDQYYGATALKRHGGDFDAAIGELERYASNYRPGWLDKGMPEHAARLDRTVQWLRDLKGSGQELEWGKPVPGRMYEVALHAEPHQFLDWDKPLNAQSPEVAQKLAAAGFTPHAARYNSVWEALFHPDRVKLGAFGKEAPAQSQILQEAGIPGIRYKDQLSRGAEGGTHNYVVFPGSEHIIEIMRKYGVTAPVAAYMLSQQSGDQQ